MQWHDGDAVACSGMMVMATALCPGACLVLLVVEGVSVATPYFPYSVH